ncbi:MAG: AgmX/PglI C-terminal domain-containing protein [Candidatus Binatia bacterium]
MTEAVSCADALMLSSFLDEESYCGAGLETWKSPDTGEILERTIPLSEAPKQPEILPTPSIDLAEDQLRQGNYPEAISTLDAIVKANPEDQKASLLHLYATVKLYNIYGYEKQIQSLRFLSDLSEKEREIVREIFLIRSEEAQKRGGQDEAREYQRLATKVVLGQPLIESAAEHPVMPTQTRPPEAIAPRTLPQVERESQSSARLASRKVDASGSSGRNDTRTRKRSGRLLVSFVLVFGLAGILVAGMLAHYAKKQGVNVSDLFNSKPVAIEQSEEKSGNSKTPLTGQVLAAEELGFKVWGTGAIDANRKESVISERIGSQLSDLRQLYQREVQNKPELMGSVILQLTIGPNGAVTKVEEYAVRIPDNEFKKAVIGETYKWRFRKPTPD